MPLFKRLSRAVSAKLTRVTLDQFIQAHASTGQDCAAHGAIPK